MSTPLSAGGLGWRILGRPQEPAYAGRFGAVLMAWMATAGFAGVLGIDGARHPVFLALTASGFLLGAIVMPLLPWRRWPERARMLPAIWMYALLTAGLVCVGPSLGVVLVLYPLVGLYLGLTQPPWSSVLLLPVALVSVLAGVYVSGHAGYLPEALLAVAVSGACGDPLALIVQRDLQSRQRLESLLAACGELAAARTVSEAADLVAELTGRLLGAHIGMLLLGEKPGSSVLVAVGTFGEVKPRDIGRLDWSTDDGGVGIAMRTGKPLFVADAPSNPFLNEYRASELGARSMLYVPIREENGQLGLVAALWSTTRPHLDDDSRRIVEVLSAQAGPVLENLRANTRLAHESQTDQLTGLQNRRSLASALANLPIGGSVVFVDLDHFKGLNDEYGHATGDEILSAFGALLRTELREERDRAIRTGGEEFVLILPDVTLDACDAIVERIRTVWRDTTPVTTFSAGVARRGEAEEPQQTLARADDALYRAKRAGRNRTVIDDPDDVAPRTLIVAG